MRKFVKFNAFELCTPKLINRTYYKDRYDHEQFEYLIKKIINLPVTERAFHYNNKVLTLMECRDANDQDFLTGYFTSARYGQKQEIIDVHTQDKTGDKERNHGVKNEAYFIIDKRNGLILIQRDFDRVVSRDMLHRYFTFHRDLAENYRTVFNRVNEEATITRDGYLKVAILPSKEFFEEIEEFARIREAFMIVDKVEETTNEGINFLAREAGENGVEDFDEMKVTLKNTLRGGQIKHVKTFFEKLIEEDKYDNYGVTGVYPSGQSRTITMAKIPQSFDRNVEHNENGLPSIEEMINEMITIAKRENPISDKNANRIEIIEVEEYLEQSRESEAR